MRKATYTAIQIKEMAGSVTDHEAMKILGELINEEIDLYNSEDMKIITQAAEILFTRSLLLKFLK